MKQFVMILEAKQPLSLGDRLSFTGNVMETDNKVHGASLRGALAYEMIQGIDPDENDWFQEAFVAGKLSFSDAYPIARGHQSSLESFGPTPFTAQSCKRFSGLRPKNGDIRDDHGVFDSIFAHMDSKAAEACPVCETRLKRFGKVLSKAGGRWAKVDLQTVNFTRTAIDDRVGSVEVQKLYTLECLDRGQLFAATIKLADGLDPQMIELLPGQTWRVGNNRTRGLGKILIHEVREMTSAEAALKTRLALFQERVRTCSKDHNYTWFTVDLQTPAQAFDPFLNPRLSFDEADFARYFEGLDHLEVVSRNVRHCQRGGWNALHNMPKPTVQMQAPGSVYLLKAKGSQASLMAGLNRMQQMGLGENFAEGYGHVHICHPFHLDRQTTQGAAV